MLDIMIDEKLNDEFNSVVKDYQEMKNSWEANNEEILPQNVDMDIKIAKIILKIVSFMKKHFDIIDKNEYRDFLAYFDSEFMFGDSEDEISYVMLSESIDDVLFMYREDEIELTMEQIELIESELNEFIKDLIEQKEKEDKTSN